MPPVLGPCVAVEDPLEVLGRLQRHDRGAVAEREQRDLRAVEVLLHDTTRSHVSRVGERGLAVVVTMTPLPAARPSSFTTYGGPNSSSAAATSSGVRQSTGRGGRAPRRPPSPPWRTPWSPRAGRPRGTGRSRRCRARYRVGDAGDQRRLGADDDQVGTELSTPARRRPRPTSGRRRGGWRPPRCPGCPARRGPRRPRGPGTGRGRARARGRRFRSRGSSRAQSSRLARRSDAASALDRDAVGGGR